MARGSRGASALTTADPRPDSTALPPPGPRPRDTSARRGRAGAASDAQVVPVRRPDVPRCLACGICGGLLRDATAISECIHAFCRQCIYDKFTKEDTKCCPTCGVLLGPDPFEKLRPDHSLQHIRSMIFHARTEDDNLRRGILTLFNEGKEKIMGRYDAHINQLKAENSKLIELLQKERTAALERTKILEERYQQELKNERAVSDGRTRTLEESFQRQLDNEREGVLVSMRMLTERLERVSDIAMSATERNRSLEEDNASLYEELENGRGDNQALMADIVEKSDELATVKYHCDMFESDKNDLENQVDNLMKELEYAKKEHERYVHQVLDAAWANNVDVQH